ncbi:MAG: hypothetical protein JXB36_11255 [Gammaproteobacteria bacterium]|nr:hypothetical protein [Gammaproteobacteria bacterium]
MLAILVAILIPAGAYLFFELGRYEAGYSMLDRQREVEALQREAASSQRTVEELKRQVAILETSRDIDRETYAQVESSLTELEAKLQAQEEELAFYRGIISPPDGVPGLRIQSLEVDSAGVEQRYVLRLVLMQAVVHNRAVRGVVTLRVAGTRDGTAMTLPLDQIAADETGEIEFGFRYFQGLERTIELPVGFEPVTVEVEVRPTEPRDDSLTRSFDWAAVSGEGNGV